MRRVAALAALVTALALVLLQVVTVPFVVFRPGPIVDVLGALGEGEDVVSVQGAQTYATNGALYYTTVSQRGGPGHELSAWSYLSARLDEEAEIVPRDEVFPPDVTREQVQSENQAAMTHSQEGAVIVALRALGRPVTERAVVQDVVPDMPAAGQVRAGDVITAVDGARVTSSSQVPDRIAASTGPVRLTLVRDEGTVDVTLTPTEREGRRLVGLVIGPDFSSDVDVSIHAGDVGGPSAGMMFALGIYDKLSPGELTGGKRIAGTGALGSDGRVLTIGGVAQKMQGAQQAGVEFFLTPRGNCPQVVGNELEGLVVTPVDTFDEARSAVEQIAAGDGQALPRCG